MKKFVNLFFCSIFFVACSNNNEPYSYSVVLKEINVISNTVEIIGEAFTAVEEIIDKGCIYSTNKAELKDKGFFVKVETNLKGIGNFICYITDLSDNTTYYAKPFLKLANGEIFIPAEEARSFTTSHRTFLVIGNTAIQVNNKTSSSSWASANTLCDNDLLGNFTDWRLPNSDELNLIFSVKELFDSFESGYYWSSTECGVNSHILINTSRSIECSGNEETVRSPKTRCVRSLTTTSKEE